MPKLALVAVVGCVTLRYGLLAATQLVALGVFSN